MHRQRKENLLTLINEDKTEIVSSGVLLVYFTESRCKIEAAEEQSYRYGLPCKVVISYTPTCMMILPSE